MVEEGVGVTAVVGMGVEGSGVGAGEVSLRMAKTPITTSPKATTPTMIHCQGKADVEPVPPGVGRLGVGNGLAPDCEERRDLLGFGTGGRLGRRDLDISISPVKFSGILVEQDDTDELFVDKRIQHQVILTCIIHKKLKTSIEFFLAKILYR